MIDSISKLNSARLINFFKDRMAVFFPLFGQKNYTKFIILSDYRTGSNFLMNLLKSHKNAHCYSELFFSKKIFWASAVYGHSETNKKALNHRYKNPYSFLDKYCYRIYSKQLKAIGFKLMYHDIYKNKNISFEKLLNYYPDLKIVHLKRKNLLERFVSQQYVAKTGEAVAIDKKEWESKSKNISKFYLDSDVLKKDFIYRTSIIKELDNIILNKGHKYIEIFYEDLQINPKEIADSVLDFLEIDKIELRTKQIKQSKGHLSENIENYEELKNYFEETEWYQFFD